MIELSILAQLHYYIGRQSTEYCKIIRISSLVFLGLKIASLLHQLVFFGPFKCSSTFDTAQKCLNASPTGTVTRNLKRLYQIRNEFLYVFDTSMKYYIDVEFQENF